MTPKPKSKIKQQAPMFIRSSNKGRGYHGELDKKHKGDRKKTDADYHKTALKVMELTKGDREKVKHYLDSAHGRHLFRNEHRPNYIKLDFNRFAKNYNPQAFYEDVQLDEFSNLSKKAFRKTFKDEWPDNKLDKKDTLATAGYTAIGAAAGAATAAAVGFPVVAGAVLGGGQHILDKYMQYRRNRKAMKNQPITEIFDKTPEGQQKLSRYVDVANKSVESRNRFIGKARAKLNSQPVKHNLDKFINDHSAHFEKHWGQNGKRPDPGMIMLGQTDASDYEIVKNHLNKGDLKSAGQKIGRMDTEPRSQILNHLLKNIPRETYTQILHHGSLKQIREQNEMDKSAEIVNAIIDKNPVNAQQAFEELIQDKLADQIDDFKSFVANNMFDIDNDQPVSDDQTFDDVDDEQLNDFVNSLSDDELSQLVDDIEQDENSDEQPVTEDLDTDMKRKIENDKKAKQYMKDNPLSDQATKNHGTRGVSLAAGLRYKAKKEN